MKPNVHKSVTSLKMTLLFLLKFRLHTPTATNKSLWSSAASVLDVRERDFFYEKVGLTKRRHFSPRQRPKLQSSMHRKHKIFENYTWSYCRTWIISKLFVSRSCPNQTEWINAVLQYISKFNSCNRHIQLLMNPFLFDPNTSFFTKKMLPLPALRYICWTGSTLPFKNNRWMP